MKKFNFILGTAFTFVTLTAHSAPEFYRGSQSTMSLETFLEKIHDKTIERMVFEAEPMEQSGLDNFALNPLNFLTPLNPAVYFIWGNLEAVHRNYEYGQAYDTLTKFRAAGYNVVIDAEATKSETQNYFASNDMYAFYWSSHGTPKGLITVSGGPGYYDTMGPDEITRSGTNIRFGVLCSCYSNVQGSNFSKALNNAPMYGFPQTVTVATCGVEAGSRFIEKANRYF